MQARCATPPIFTSANCAARGRSASPPSTPFVRNCCAASRSRPRCRRVSRSSRARASCNKRRGAHCSRRSPPHPAARRRVRSIRCSRNATVCTIRARPCANSSIIAAIGGPTPPINPRRSNGPASSSRRRSISIRRSTPSPHYSVGLIDRSSASVPICSRVTAWTPRSNMRNPSPVRCTARRRMRRDSRGSRPPFSPRSSSRLRARRARPWPRYWARPVRHGYWNCTRAAPSACSRCRINCVDATPSCSARPGCTAARACSTTINASRPSGACAMSPIWSGRPIDSCITATMRCGCSTSSTSVSITSWSTSFKIPIRRSGISCFRCCRSWRRPRANARAASFWWATASSRFIASAAPLRNPLLQPRVIREDRRYAREGALIAARIRRLIDDQTPVAHGGAARTLRYDDVMILVRQRTHLPAYGQALRDAGIPYLSANRGTLLQCVEIQDMKNLLTTLIVPYDNLALAAVLRSPLFACSDDDLIALAQYPTHTHWFERLLELGPRRATGTPLARAAMPLARWQQRAGQRPEHDLLDLIYSEGNVLARFDAAFPAHLKPRVRANLTRFLELALEVDSGRYPSLSAFLHRLRTVESDEDDAPDEAPVAAAEGGVRILTVHAAKGLEAPVVFLADAASVGRNNRAYQALVRWPTLAAAPSQFFLAGKGSELDRVSAALLDEQRREEAREQANLLYVALTRAQQYLFISGCEPQHRDERGWYGLIAAQLGDPGALAAQGWHIEQGAAPAIAPLAQAQPLRAPPPIAPRLAQPIRMPPRDIEIAPSRRDAGNATGDGDEDGRERGRAMHRFLELLCSEGRCAAAEAQRRVAYELGLDASDARLAAWWQEAAAVYQEPALKMLFDDAYYDAAYNEVPMHYRQNDGEVYGEIDRMVIRGDRCVVGEYKTHRGAADDPQRHAALFQEQLRLYAEGVALLWPDIKVEPYLLFTVNRRLYSL